jgi:hypothetical protein
MVFGYVLELGVARSSLVCRTQNERKEHER